MPKRYAPWRHPSSIIHDNTTEADADVQSILARDDGEALPQPETAKFRFVITRHKMEGEVLMPFDTDGTSSSAPFEHPGGVYSDPRPVAVVTRAADCVEAIWLVRDM